MMISKTNRQAYQTLKDTANQMKTDADLMERGIKRVKQFVNGIMVDTTEQEIVSLKRSAERIERDLLEVEILEYKTICHVLWKAILSGDPSTDLLNKIVEDYGDDTGKLPFLDS